MAEVVVGYSCPLYFRIAEDYFEFIKLVIRSVLGFGMSGEVVLAQSTILPEYMVALKMLSVHDKSCYSYKKNLFNKEVWAMKKLNHPHLMKATYAVECPNCLYLSMDYYPKGSLETRLSELDYAKTERYLVQLASAIKYMHDQRIVHCDIKLPNILVKSDEEVILTDFGLCLPIPADVNTVAAKEVGGTPAYIAPERKSNDLDMQVDPQKMDMYSLGVVLFGMAFRVNPENRKFNYVRVTNEATYLPELLRFCILNLLKTDPDERCSASDLLEMLRSQSQWGELAKDYSA